MTLFTDQLDAALERNSGRSRAWEELPAARNIDPTPPLRAHWLTQRARDDAPADELPVAVAP
jgi:hypothetical protein